MLANIPTEKSPINGIFDMNNRKAKALRKAAQRYANNHTMPAGYGDETWYYYDQQGSYRLGRCLRKLYKIAKNNYKRRLHSHA